MFRKLIGALVGLAMMGMAGTANATLIGLNSANPGTVYEIDPDTGAATAIVTVDSFTSLVGATFLDGTLYGSDICGDGCFSVDSIDLTTGTTTFVSNQDGSSNWHGLASDEGAGLMFSIDINDSFILKTLAPDGTVTSVGTGTGIDGRGMAYDDANGILYATGGSNSLYEVDTLLGTSMLIGSLGIFAIPTLGSIGLAYDEILGILYANSGVTNSLYTVDVSTGAATLVGANGFPRIDGLAWIAVPEPATIALFGIGLAGLGFMTRRRKRRQPVQAALVLGGGRDV